MRHRLYGDTPSKCKWGHARKWAIMSPILIRSTWSTPICLSDAPKHMLSAVNMAENQLGIPKADVEAIKASFAPGKIFRFLQFKENFMKPLPSTNISTYTLFTYIMYMTVYITKVIYWILRLFHLKWLLLLLVIIFKITVASFWVPAFDWVTPVYFFFQTTLLAQRVLI